MLRQFNDFNDIFFQIVKGAEIFSVHSRQTPNLDTNRLVHSV